MKEEEKWFIDNFVKPIEKQAYQDRLDKVLSKMKKGKAFNAGEYYFYKLNISLEIYYSKEKIFYLRNHYNIDEFQHIISLETVESLLKDMGEEL